MNVIFLHPDSDRNSISGSSLRPRKIKEAFEEKGYDLTSITGNREERVRAFNQLKLRLKSGDKFDYLYVESLSRPMNLRIKEVRGIKWYQKERLDYEIIDLCLSYKIPVGFFLRDVHWDFLEEMLPQKTLKNKYFKYFLKKFGLKEVDYLKSRSITVFGPSTDFLTHLKKSWNLNGILLRPGCETRTSDLRCLNQNLSLLYVGGCTGIYNPEVFLIGAEKIAELNFTLCTRDFEWERVRSQLGKYSVNVIHKSGEELNPYYDRAQVAVYSLPPIGYVKLAFGVKLVEYVANGLPIIAYKGTEAARFIEEHDIGWTIKYNSEEVTKALNHISKAGKEYERKQQNVISLQSELTWQKVIDRLENNLLQ